MIGGAVRDYLGEVRDGAFPSEAHSFRMAPAKASAQVPASANIQVVAEEKIGAIYGGVAADGTKR